MQFTELNAELRSKKGTGSARAARRSGLLPAVVYGKGLESQSVTVNEKEIDKILRTKLGKNSLIRLNVAGKGQNVIIKDYQGHPLTRRLTHVDFMVVREDQKVSVWVPVRLDGKPIGLVQGGVIEWISREVELLCQVGRIPAEIVVDITGLNVGQNIHLADVKLPEGVSYNEKVNATIVAMDVPKEEAAAPVAAAATEATAVPATAQKAEATPAAGAAPAKAEAKPAAKK